MIKSALKRFLALTPYRVVRDRGMNRFQAMDTSLKACRARGYAPGVVIDGGAHLGWFSLETRGIFPDARFFLVEPQAACHAALDELSRLHGFTVHKCALAERSKPLLISGSPTANTGVHVVDADSDAVAVEARSLDELFADTVKQGDRALLKLDLQGYEMHALRGASRLLQEVELVLTEVSFFGEAGEPGIAELVSFFDEAGFVLYDVASLSGRPRDNRLQQGDLLFCKRGSDLLQDTRWS